MADTRAVTVRTFTTLCMANSPLSDFKTQLPLSPVQRGPYRRNHLPGPSVIWTAMRRTSIDWSFSACSKAHARPDCRRIFLEHLSSQCAHVLVGMTVRSPMSTGTNASFETAPREAVPCHRAHAGILLTLADVEYHACRLRIRLGQPVRVAYQQRRARRDRAGGRFPRRTVSRAHCRKSLLAIVRSLGGLAHGRTGACHHGHRRPGPAPRHLQTCKYTVCRGRRPRRKGRRVAHLIDWLAGERQQQCLYQDRVVDLEITRYNPGRCTTHIDIPEISFSSSTISGNDVLVEELRHLLHVLPLFPQTVR